ncbi:hypothetical protein D7S78_21745 [Ralstonia pickettii]|nr:hypothetical protein [Ralstonia pickettii]MBA9853533.1 hypothetical protein [Ralstonia pickettii]MBA9876228.1 hypothetical protein [Ralstonia pickettii]MBA9889605.1 hypothetical protein [Ralstonia pickettii]MBA9921075.1 hypothetical protein [Ralstonia pickettii]
MKEANMKNLLKKANAKYWAITAAASVAAMSALPASAQTVDLNSAIASAIDDGVTQVKTAFTTNGPKLIGVAIGGVIVGVGIKLVKKLRGAA